MSDPVSDPGTDSVLPTGPRRAGHRSAPRRRGRGWFGCLAVLVALAVVLGGIGYVVVKGTDAVSGMLAGPDDFDGQGSGSVRVQVEQGATAGDIGDALAAAGVVASADAFTDAAAADPDSVSIQPGTYEMREEMSARAALDLMLSGKALVDDAVTIPEGYTVERTLEALADDSPLSLRELRNAAQDLGSLGLPGYAGGELEGYLFPSTYQVSKGSTAREVLGEMVSTFKDTAGDLGLEPGARRLGYTPAEVVTVASIVQSEARRPGDFAKVARVIYNRLDDGMRLEMDSTVKYVTGSEGVFTTDEERDIDSPYNTYKVTGLPPGPIADPGEQALRAALKPADGDWTYFTTVNLETGRTLFTDSYQQHLRNGEKLEQWCTGSDLC